MPKPQYINTIEIPENPAPPSLESQIRGAIYSAVTVYHATIIKCGLHEIVLIDKGMYESLVAQSER